MAPGNDDFYVAGPFHIRSLRWCDPYQRRAVMASLVKGVSVMEKDRVKGRRDHLALAPLWWKSFSFELESEIKDDAGSMIIGAIYKFKSTDCGGTVNSLQVQNCPPSYVVAFRGTIPIPTSNTVTALVQSTNTTMRDFKDDFMCLFHHLHNSSRFKVAKEKVWEIINTFGPSRICLAGHSLGSACAMLIGKEMARSDFILETYLFNSPFISIPIEYCISPDFSRAFDTVNSITKVGVAYLVKFFRGRPVRDSSFMALSKWFPHILVSPSDPICSGYIRYFERRKFMKSNGLGKLENIATQNSYKSLVSGALELGWDFEPEDILPSAHLIVNTDKKAGPIDAHKLKHWWHPWTRCQSSSHSLS
ncbi:GDSL esterase/lipase At4g10955-like [Punica granatum]|uniref:GDSL esterase/lipase At4g10955-like n=1 Tax=Punica granatum TaxID=22663 RepID=A0A6P8CP84_PUNGR|nr:GDSL esterase/lipase At4g10955-like [Punica granatum]